MMRILAAVLLTVAALGVARAQAPAAGTPLHPVDIHLTVADQNDVVGVCALAMRSPQITDANGIITLGEFCARLRNLIVEANRKASTPAVAAAPAPTQTTKE